MEVDEKAIWIARRLLGFIALRELLTATCQVCTVSLKAGLYTYNRFARGALETPNGKTA